MGVRIHNHESICDLVDVLRQPLVSATLNHANEVPDYTTDSDDID